MNAYQNERERRPYRPDESGEIEVAIYDRSHPKGLMHGPDKANALRQALFEMMYRDLMSEADVSPKFNGNNMENGVFRLQAVNLHSAEFVEDIVDRMPPPWPDAQLCVVYDKAKAYHKPSMAHQKPEVYDKLSVAYHKPELYDKPSVSYRTPEVYDKPSVAYRTPEVYDKPSVAYRTPEVYDKPSVAYRTPEVYQKPVVSRPKIVVEAFVPGEMFVKEEILYKINQFDNRIRTDQWQTVGCRRLGQGQVFTFTIDSIDFEVLNTYDGFVPYNGMRIEFRVIKNPDIISNIL